MKRPVRLVLAGVAAVALTLLAACDDSESLDRESAEATVQDAAREVSKESREAWGGLRTDGERLIDRVQVRNDPEAKKELLDRCRGAEERLRKARDGNADRVNELCDKIRDADVNNRTTWDEIKARFSELDSRLRG